MGSRCASHASPRLVGPSEARLSCLVKGCRSPLSDTRIHADALPVSICLVAPVQMKGERLEVEREREFERDGGVENGMVRRACSAVLPACGSQVGSWEAGQEDLALYPGWQEQRHQRPLGRPRTAGSTLERGTFPVCLPAIDTESLTVSEYVPFVPASLNEKDGAREITGHRHPASHEVGVYERNCGLGTPAVILRWSVPLISPG